MKIRIGALFITTAVLLNLPACSYIKTLFPDKEKDYQYTTEIPPLILPDDLKKEHIPSLTTPAPSTPPPDADAEAVVPPPADKAPVEEAAATTQAANEPAMTTPMAAASPESSTVIPDTEIRVERIRFNEGENRLHINVPFTRAWLIVSKALSRKGLEVTERNQESRLFTILYDPDEQKAKDATYWDDVMFIFRGIRNNEKTYLLKLDENNQQTDIVVLDKDQQLLSDAGSVKLLTLLEETIKADLAKK